MKIDYLLELFDVTASDLIDKIGVYQILIHLTSRVRDHLGLEPQDPLIKALDGAAEQIEHLDNAKSYDQWRAEQPDFSCGQHHDHTSPETALNCRVRRGES